MNTKTETDGRDDFIGITLAVLMFALQGCMLMTMTTERVANQDPGSRSAIVADAGDRAFHGNPV